MSASKILVVDDEPDIRDMLRQYLEAKDFAVTCADGGESARAAVNEDTFDLIVLDIAMPGEDGLSLARHFRETLDVGIIMVTASGEVVDRIIGLEVGADDYVAKPVNLRELHARIKAVLRRARSGIAGSEPAGEAPDEHVAVFGETRLHLDSHELYAANGEEIRITSMEFDLLKAFAEHPNRVLSRDQLLDLAHNRSWEPFDRSIDIRVGRIRRKVEPDPAKPQVIKTVHGAGYIYSPP